MGEAIASSISARNCFWASNPVPVLRIFDRVWACAPSIAQTYLRIESLRRSTPACVKPSICQERTSSRLLRYHGYDAWHPSGEEWALRHMRMSICPRWCHEGTSRSESLTSVIEFLPPVLIRRNGELSAKPLIGSAVICILVP